MSTIRIPSHPNLDDEICLNQTFKLKSYCRFQFWVIFNLFFDIYWLNLTNFWLFLIKFDQFSIESLKKMTFMSIKRSKKSNLIKKSKYLEYLDLFWTLSINFWSLSIDFELFDIFRTDFNQIGRDNLKFYDKFKS